MRETGNLARKGFQPAEDPFIEFTKKILSRDTKLAVERELTKSNLFSHSALRRKQARLFRYMLDKRRTSPDWKSGQTILTCEIFTRNHADNFHVAERLTGSF